MIFDNAWSKKKEALLAAQSEFLSEKIKAGFVSNLAELAQESKKSILDLSTFSAKKFNTYNELGFKNITFADFYLSLQDYYQASAIARNFSKTMLNQLIMGSNKKSAKKKFDVVLCWDVLNYFSQENTKILLKFLFENTTNPSYLFALIYNRQNIPINPVNYEIDMDKKHFYCPKIPEQLKQSQFNISAKQMYTIFEPWYLQKTLLCNYNIKDISFSK